MYKALLPLRPVFLLLTCCLIAMPVMAGVSSDVSVTKTDGVTAATPGGSVTYTIVVSNSGMDITGVSVTDTFPATLTCTWTCSASAGSSCTAMGTGDISDTVDLLDAGTATYTASCSIASSATGTLSNTATVSAAGDPNPANDSATDADTVLTASADLSISKADSADPVIPGGSYSYTITVSNAGPSDATGVVVTDNLPAGVTLVSTSGCAEDPNGTPTCTLGTIAASGMASYTINVTAPGSDGQVSNTATVSATTGDPNSANDSATETTDVQASADLTITKTDSSVSAIPGQSTTYTIVATNNGPSDVTGAIVVDNFISDLTCTWTCAASAGSSCAAAGSGDINESVDLLNGGTATFTAVCDIDPGATATLTNFTSISSSVPDPVSNNGATDGDTALVPTVDLSIAKADSADPVAVGSDFTYTITVNNAGPSDATGVVVTDNLPAGVSLVSSSGCAEDPAGAPSCTLGTVAAGGMASYTLTVTAPGSGSQISNTATVTTAATDTNAGNDSDTETTDLTDAADLTITKTDSSVSAIPGQSTTYTIVAINNGPTDVTGATVEDNFTSELTCNWTCVASAGSSCAAMGSGDINESVDLLNGGTATFTAVCDIDPSATGTLTNFTSISSALPDPVSNNGATDGDTALIPTADLSITKTDSADPVDQGETFTYTMTVSNAGPSDATNVVVTDTLPAGVNLVSSSGCTEDPSGAPTCTLGTIAAGGMASYTLTVTAPNSAGQITNTATVTSSATDNNSGNDTATETTDVLESADLSITKMDSVDPVGQGDAFAYTITVSNAGPGDASNVVVTDNLPAGVTLVSTTGCAEDPNGAPTCTLGTIMSGSMASYTINVTAPNVSGQISNTAAVATSTPDPNSGNDSATETTDVSTAADLAITKTDGVTSAAPGDSVTYSIVAINNGPDNTLGASVTDTFPADLTCTWTCVASAGSACTAMGSGDISESVDLLNGGTATFTAVCAIDPAATGTLSNTATISSPKEDPDTGNNSATDGDTVLVPSADLSITKVDSIDPVGFGQAYTYTITVENLGPSDTTNVVVTDNLPPGVTLVGTSGCAEDPNGAPTCSLGSLAAGSMVSYTIDVTAPMVRGQVVNTATVTSDAADPNSANDSASESTNVFAEADVSVTKTDGVTTAVPGETVTYTIVATNNGPDDVALVAVEDLFPAELTCSWTCVASAGSACAASGNGDIVETVDLLVGGTATFTAVCDIDPNATGTLSNTVIVTSPIADPNPANDTATDGDTVLEPTADLVLVAMSDPNPVDAGEPVTIFVDILNLGPSTAQDVELDSMIAPELTVIQTFGCAEDPGGVPTCTIGMLEANESRLVEIEAIAPVESGAFESTFTVSASTPDPDNGNDVTLDAVNVAPEAIEVPTLNTVGLMVMVLLMVGFAVRRMRP